MAHVKVRFAPSPTGALHVGGVRTALFNYLFARNQGGEFILRVEDTDQNRFVPGAEDYIIEALQWCGIEPDFGPHRPGMDAPYRQSERKEMYKNFAIDLIERGMAYYAFDTTEQLEQMRLQLEAAGNKAAQYNAISRDYMHNSLRMPASEVQQRLDDGEPYVIRIKLPRKEDVRFEDIVRGWVTVNTSQMDDKVLLKSDGMPTYHLANVVDDHLMNITHVIRGEEWLPSAPLHVMLYQAFGWDRPAFAHLPLLLSPDGNGKLSKRDGDKYGFPIFPLQWTDPFTGAISSGYREAGYLPEAFVNFLALLGWNPGDNAEIMSLDELVSRFSLERVGKSGVKFDKVKSIWFNQHYIKEKAAEGLLPDVKQALAQAQIPLAGDDYILKTIPLLKERVEYLPDFATMGRYFYEVPSYNNLEPIAKKWTPEINDFLLKLQAALNSCENWEAATLESLTKELAQSLEIKIGTIMPVLRFAITGVGAGPGIFHVMEVLEKEFVLPRLAAVEQWPARFSTV
jgi:glutamyl-tRNA synthetase